VEEILTDILQFF